MAVSEQSPTGADDPDVETVAGLSKTDGPGDPHRNEPGARVSTTPDGPFDASGPTTCRHPERLRDAGFVVERTRPDPDGEHHRQVDAPNLARVILDLEEAILSVRITQCERMADLVTRLVEEAEPGSCENYRAEYSGCSQRTNTR